MSNTLNQNLKSIYSALKSKKEFKKAVHEVTGLELETLSNYFCKDFNHIPDYIVEKSIPIAQNCLKMQYESDRATHIKSLEVNNPETVKY